MKPPNVSRKSYALNALALDARAGAAKILPTSTKRSGLKYRGPSDKVQRPGHALSAIGTKPGNVIGL